MAGAFEDLTIHRYPMSALLPDSLRAAFGVACTAGPLAFMDLARPLMVILGGLGVIFLLFAVRTLQHGLCQIELSADGIASRGPLSQYVAWDDMTMFKMARYATPRRPSEGWYQLTLRDGGAALKIESTIDGFEQIVDAAVRAAKRCHLTLDPTTEDNLRSFEQRSARHDRAR